MIAIYILVFFLLILFFYSKFLSMELKQQADKNRTEWMLGIIFNVSAVLTNQYFIYIGVLFVCGIFLTMIFAPMQLLWLAFLLVWLIAVPVTFIQ